MNYPLSERARTQKRWDKYFRHEIRFPLDVRTSVALGCLILDTFKLELELKKHYPNYDWDNISMRDVIRDHYGNDAMAFVENMF